MEEQYSEVQSWDESEHDAACNILSSPHREEQTPYRRAGGNPRLITAFLKIHDKVYCILKLHTG